MVSNYNDQYPYGDIGPSNAKSNDGFCIEKVEQDQGFKKLLIDGDYISSLPQDPLYDIDQCSNPFNTDCHCYIYRTETADKYKLFAKTEQQDFKPAKQDGGISDIYYEAYSPVQGSNQIVLGWPWYEAGPYLNGIVGAWTFDEGFGTTAYDTSGNNNNGTLKNGPTWVDGKSGKALSFDGADDYVNCGNDESLAVGGNFTYELWVQYKGTSSSKEWPYLLNAQDAHIYPGIRGGGSYGAGQPFVEWGLYPTCNGSAYTNIQVPSVTDGRWHHIAATYDGSVVKSYFDGAFYSQRAQNGMCPGNPVFYIGQYYNGYIDEVRIYNRALSADEIAANYAAGGN